MNYAEKTANLKKKIRAYEESLSEHKNQLVDKTFEINKFVKTFYNTKIEDSELKIFEYEVYYTFKFEHKNIPMIISDKFILELKHLFDLKHVYIYASTIEAFEHDSCSGKKEWFTYPTLEVQCIFWDVKG
jgi:hypothetical protein